MVFKSSSISILSSISTCWLIAVIVVFNISQSVGLEEPSENSIQHYQDFDSTSFNDSRNDGKKILDYWKNGIRLDIRVVPAVNDSNGDDDDHFPNFPVRDLGRCVMEFSMMCMRDRMARYIDTIGRLNKITLFDGYMKFVKVHSASRRVYDERALQSTSSLDRSIDQFFDNFALRFNLPKWNAKREQNQIDFMFDDRGLVEGRGGKGGGGGGKKGGGGGKCKKMMMAMMMCGKMKLMGMAGLMAMKGMMMSAITMMMTKAMLIMQLMNKKGGGGGGGGGHSGGGGGGAPLKEIVLLTKASGGGGGGGHSGGGGHGGDSYSAPPPSSYGPPPSGGGGGYDGGGGGWGRSFDSRPITITSADQLTNHISLPQNIENDSIIYAYPHVEGRSDDNQNWRSYKTTDYIGEVHETDERMDRKLDSKDNHMKNRLGDSKFVYADNWKNYEAADRIWNVGTPIVATKISTK